jgi:hypothetical protein
VSDGWKFYQDADARWRWQYVMHGRTVAQARLGHERQSSCVAEARVHGYREEGSAAAVNNPRAHEARAKGKKR